MFLPDISIKRPVLTTMMIVVIFLFGYIGFTRLGIDLYPEVDIPMVTVTTVWQGASPETMDADVTDPIEEELVTIEGIKHITSFSGEGVSQIIVEFILEKNVDIGAQEVRDKVNEAMDELPRDIEPPIIDKLDINAQPIVWLDLMSEKLSIKELSEYADDVLKPKFQTISGVGTITLGGYLEREMRIWLDAKRLEAHGLTASEVKKAIEAKNVEFPGGWLEGKSREFTVKTMGELYSAKEFDQLILSFKNGSPVRLKDVGYAEDGTETKRAITRRSGVPVVGLGVAKRSGANTVAVARRVINKVEDVQKILPPDVHLRIGADFSQFIVDAIDDARKELFLGGLCAAIVVLIFLRSIGSTVITGVSIPTSIIGAFALMYFLDFTMNMLTMLALTLCTGMVIDDAIIIIENIYRHQEEGESRVDAARKGSSEIAFAAMAATFSIVGVFIPVAFMGGIIGRFFFQFGVTVSVTILLSLFIALTLIPMLSSQFLTYTRTRGFLFNILETAFKALEDAYRKSLGLCLKHKAIVVGITLTIFILSFFLGSFIGIEFTPKHDQGKFIVRMETPIGSSIDFTEQKLEEAEKILCGLPYISHIISVIGFGETQEVHKILIFSIMKPRSQRETSQHKAMAYLRRRLCQIPDIKVFLEEVSSVGDVGGERKTAVSFDIMGMDLEKVLYISEKTMEEMRKIPYIVDVDDNLELKKPYVRIFIDRDKAGDLGVDIRNIASTIYTLIAGERLSISKFKDPVKGKKYDIRLRLTLPYRDKPESINQLLVRGETGNLVRLSNLVEIQETLGPNVINRKDRQKVATIYADTEKGMTSDEALTLGMDIAKKYIPDESYTVVPSGQAETMRESFDYLRLALILAIILTYIILASQFDHFIHPLTVMLALPLTTAGAFGALLVTQNDLSIMSMIGIIMLMGIVTKNSILLVDYTNTLRSRGIDRENAILTASPVRLRPILMTAFSTIAAVLPTALALGEGSEIRQPMAVVVAGGMATSTLLTLFVVPVGYILLDELSMKIRGMAKKILRK